jgi:hypothetical protein
MMFDFGGSLTPNWIKYGFAAMEIEAYPHPDSLSAQLVIAGRMPTVSEMMNETPPAGIDFYDFSNSMVQFLVFKFGHNEFNSSYMNINGSNIAFGHWSIGSNSDFETIWYEFCKLFYFNSEIIKQQTPSDHFNVWMTDSDLAYYNDLIPEAERKLKTYSDSMMVEIPHKLQLVVYPTLCEYQASVMTGPCNQNSTSVGGGVGVSIFQMVSPSDVNSPLESMVWLMTHELAHVVQFNIKNNFMPAWLSEGFAMFMPTGRLSQEDITEMRIDLTDHLDVVYSNLGHLPTKSELSDYNFVGQNNIDYYLIGQAMNDWIVKFWGYNGLKQLILSDGANVGALGFNND